MMTNRLVAVLVLFATAFVFTQTSAQARGYHKKHSHHAAHHQVKRKHLAVRGHHRYRAKSYRAARRHIARSPRLADTTSFRGVRVAGRPGRWCGWWLGNHLGMQKRDLWLARNWAKVGINAGQPGIGVVVVWRNHVGIITGRTASGWVVKSGNDGNAVRERVRSISGAIAFRHVGGGGAS
jgi:hypothetical protein